MKIGEGQAVQPVVHALKGGVGFPRKPYHDIRADADIGYRVDEPADDVPGLSGRIGPAHGFQQVVVAMLHGQMQVPAQPRRVVSEQGDQVPVHRRGPDGTQPQPGQPGSLQELPDHGVEGGRRGQVRTVLAEVDAGEHDLGVPAVYQGTGLAQHGLRRQAAVPAAGPGNDAEGTELIASVLDLQHGPGTVFKSGNVETFVEMRHLRPARHPGGGRGAPAAPQHAVDEFALFHVAQDEVHALDFQQLIRMGLGVTTRGDDHGLRPAAHGLAERLPGPRVGLVRHRAGIDDVDVRGFGEGYDAKAPGNELLADRLGLVLIQTAAERMQGYRRSVMRDGHGRMSHDEPLSRRSCAGDQPSVSSLPAPASTVATSPITVPATGCLLR